jgi:hypothetical protein
MVENMVDFSQKSTTFSAMFPPSSISKPHGADMVNSRSVTIFFEKSQCHIRHGGTMFSPWWHHGYAMVAPSFESLKPL